MTKRVLISGASVSGPVTAFWLARHGFDVTVIESAPNLRLGGQNVDLSDAARDVVRLMGLEEEIRGRHTGEKGLQFVDTHNRARASFPAKAHGSLTREIEILRGDLAEIFVNASRENVTYRFGQSIAVLENRDKNVAVTFEDGTAEPFDIVIAADGMNSSTRKLIVGEGDHESYLGCWASYFTVPRLDRDNDWWRWYTSPTGVIAFLRPDNQGTMRASVNFLSNDGHPPRMTLDERKNLLRSKLKGAGWESERLAEALSDVDDLFLGPLHQIRAATWWNGRCVLAGDAAHCPTPYTGMGTTLAVIGAYVLAHEIARHDVPQEAFRAYEAAFRPFAEKSQQLPPGVPHAAYATSEWKVRLINTAAAVAASAPVQRMISFFIGGETAHRNEFTLPDYSGQGE